METYFNNGEKYLFKVVIDKDDNLVLRARKIRGDIPISKRIIEKLINELVNNPNFELNNYEHRQLQEILDDVNNGSVASKDCRYESAVFQHGKKNE